MKGYEEPFEEAVPKKSQNIMFSNLNKSLWEILKQKKDKRKKLNRCEIMSALENTVQENSNQSLGERLKIRTVNYERSIL